MRRVRQRKEAARTEAEQRGLDDAGYHAITQGGHKPVALALLTGRKVILWIRRSTVPSSAPSGAAVPPMAVRAHERACAGTAGRWARTVEERPHAAGLPTAPSCTSLCACQSVTAQRSPADRHPVHHGRFISFEG